MAGTEWVREEGVTCVVCPSCAFTFDASHYDTDGGGDGYSCPACLENRVQRLADHWDTLDDTPVRAGLYRTALRAAMTGE